LARFIATVESHLPPAALFDYLADMRNAAKWDPGVSTATLEGASDEVREQCRFLVTLLLGGKPKQVVYELAEYQRPDRAVLQGSLPGFTSTDVVTVRALPEGGSRAIYEANLELHGAFRLARPLINIAFQRIGRQAAAGLQREVGA
jgi:hypothetical protein